MNKKLFEHNIKICAVICEYNPFHNGHRYQLEEIKRKCDCDAVLCLMSGNFVQRGEAAFLDKFTRAKHAVLAGADCVMELPLPFATANAEIFALGAIGLLSKIPSVTTLAFGCECGHASHFLSLAKILLQEPESFKAALKEHLDGGESFAKARFLAAQKIFPDIDERLLSSPNNILGMEYTKAILRLNANIDILPLQRVGAGYTDENLKENYSSASAIRRILLQEERADLSGNLPDFTLKDFPLSLKKADYARMDVIEHYALIAKTSEEIAETCDCTEGLENRLKSLAKEFFTAEEVVKEATSKRYTSARIRRILLANVLGITEAFIRRGLEENPFCKVLALKRENADMVLSSLQKSQLPLLIRKGDETLLTGWAKECFVLTEKSDLIYDSLSKRDINFNATQFIE